MRILLLTQYFWPENFRINALALALKSKGCEVEILTGQPNYPDLKLFRGYKFWLFSKEVWNGITINRMPIFPRSNSAISLILNYLSFVIFGILFSPVLLFRKKYDVIFVYAPSPIFQSIPASFLGWLKKIPVVLWVQDLWPESVQATGYISSEKLLRHIEHMVKFTYAHVDLILVQSEAFIKSVSYLAPQKKIIYYPNSAENCFYCPNIVNVPTIKSLQDGFSILFAGNIGTAQSLETIVSAAEMLKDYKDIKIVILGDGSKLSWLQTEISLKKINNIFLEGRYPIETMPLLLRQACVLLVSLSDQPVFELTIPSKIQSYLAAGIPIIACLNGEGARVIREANAGVTVNAEDDKGLARAIIKLYKMPSVEREAMGNNGRIYFKQHFDEEMLVSELINHFKTLITKRIPFESSSFRR